MIVKGLCIVDPLPQLAGFRSTFMATLIRQLDDLVCLYYSTRKRNFNCYAVLYTVVSCAIEGTKTSPNSPILSGTFAIPDSAMPDTMNGMYRCCLAGHIYRVLGEVLAEGSGGLATVNRGVPIAHNQRMLVRSNGLHMIEG